MGRRTVWTVYFLTVAYFGALFVAVVSQPVYRAGLDILLRPEGYQVERLIGGGLPEDAGILPGDRIVKINGYDPRELFRRSRESSGDYLRTVSGIFTASGDLRIVTARGREVTIVLSPRPFLFRLRSANRTVLSNIFFGLLLATIGTGFSLKEVPSPERYGRRSFFTFTIFGAIAISLSYFHSLWSLPFLIAWFIALEAAGVVAIMAMVVFALRFPRPAERGTGTALALMIIPPLGRAVLLVTARADPLGPGHFFIHAYVVVGILAFTLIQVIRYRHSVAGSRRRIRWIFLGAFVSVLPYLLYMFLIILVGSFIEYEQAGLLNQISGFVLLLFPVTVGFGLTRFRSLDVDRLITQSVVYLVLGTTTSLVVLLFSALSLDANSAVVPVLVVLAVTFFGPGYFGSVERWANRFVLRRHTRIETRLEGLNAEIEASEDTDALFARLCTFLTEIYEPSYLRVRRIVHPGRRLYEFMPDTTSWVPSVSVPVSDSYQACTRFGEFRLLLRIRNPAADDRYELVLGPRSDEDIYTESDLTVLHRVIDRVEQRLPALVYLDQLREKVAELQRALAERTGLLQEVQHRVKNNLQVMSSLVRLREHEIPDEPLRVQFRIVRDQIDAMALLYENVYNEGLRRTVEMREYLGAVVHRMDLQPYCRGSAVRIRSEVEHRTVSPSVALPCGLLVVGYIAKVLAAACDDPGLTHIEVRFSIPRESGEADTALLDIEHDGPTIHENAGTNDILHSLTAQLGGTLRYAAGAPNRLTVRFTIAEPPVPGRVDPPGSQSRSEEPR